ncbi:hypothetical protein H072_5006 [Dactylellina haptotyla CBS 200.50]|uniref:C2H2-type domain-containing protein n=1 Tax=Dactylellina haptotyla (strain CBS 200.50) TaxID=1284197 RepID=S8C0I6_DACHA|nr:hypothetical protein H072_5006 [Dactylellina haptotyla CBS 200.50]
MTTLVASPGPHQAASTATSHPYTCNTCQVAFKSSDGQRNHMHTDWHRYNLKRRIAELPPISSEIFAEKVLSSQAADREARDRASFEKPCQACSRTYYSQNAYNNHINSQKHKQRVAALSRIAMGDGTESVVSHAFSMDDTEDGTEIDPAEDSRIAKEELSSIINNLSITNSSTATTRDSASDSLKDGEIPSLPITECLFCANPSPTLQQNLEHMAKLHGLFIPEQRYLVNLEGLVRYLGQKVLIGHTCLYCNKAKGGLDGIRTHMRDKGHCMIAFDSEEEMLEIGEFYDFRSTYDSAGSDDEDEEDWEDEQGNKAKGRDETWETDSEASSCDSEEIGSLRVAPSRKLSHHRSSSSHHLEDGWHSHAHSHSHTHATHVYFTETEMHLPTGRSVGHRSLARYYRQNLRDHPRFGEEGDDTLAIKDGDAESTGEGDSAAPTNAAEARRNKALISRGNGGQGLALASKAAQHRAKKLEKKDRAVEERGRGRYQAKIEKAANNQKHYRDPNLQ